MSGYISIVGGNALSGSVCVSGAKNSALPLLMASLLTAEECEFRNVPKLDDVAISLRILEQFGAQVQRGPKSIRLKTPQLIPGEASYSLIKSLRASFWILAPLLARGRSARVALPGGDAIGARPVDIHLIALQEMGAEVSMHQGVVTAVAANGLRPADISFRFPSVGATHQLLMAAAITPGKTVIRNAAREPEVVQLAEMLSQMGAKITGAGGAVITIEGKERLGGCSIDLIGDRIEAGTYIMAACATKGAVEVLGFNPDHLGALLPLMEQMGVEFKPLSNGLFVDARAGLKAVRAKTGPYPELATDLQAPLMAALVTAKGESVIEETVYEGRFGHVSELSRMGAHIAVAGTTATITGVEELSAAPVEIGDIRAGAALAIGALAARGESKLFEIHHIRRGYEDFEERIRGLGGQASYRVDAPEDYLMSGC